VWENRLGGGTGTEARKSGWSRDSRVTRTRSRGTCEREFHFRLRARNNWQIIETGPDTAYKLSVGTAIISLVALLGGLKIRFSSSSDVQHVFVLRQLRATRRHWKWVVWNHSKSQAETRWGRECSFGRASTAVERSIDLSSEGDRFRTHE